MTDGQYKDGYYIAGHNDGESEIVELVEGLWLRIGDEEYISVDNVIAGPFTAQGVLAILRGMED